MILKAGLTEIHVERDARAMGENSAAYVARSMKEAAARGERPALWLMAAPSGFPFYSAFAELARGDAELAALCREAAWFQFDDYPIARGDPRFPITFRHLLETRFFGPLHAACGGLRDIHFLELGGPDDEAICAEYARLLLDAAADPKTCLIQLKGIGMDGHWGFHGAETPLEGEPALVRVAMNEANIHQQMLDWPDFFHSAEEVPRYACTCNVALFLKARIVVDNVPQASKIYSILAAYGNDLVSGLVPSSALKTHPRSRAYLTQEAAWALLEFRKARSADPCAPIPPPVLARLDAVWESKDQASQEANVRAMRATLGELGML